MRTSYRNDEIYCVFRGIHQLLSSTSVQCVRNTLLRNDKFLQTFMQDVIHGAPLGRSSHDCGRPVYVMTQCRNLPVPVHAYLLTCCKRLLAVEQHRFYKYRDALEPASEIRWEKASTRDKWNFPKPTGQAAIASSICQRTYTCSRRQHALSQVAAPGIGHAAPLWLRPAISAHVVG